MDLLVIGSGGREHALIKALARSPRVGMIYAAPGNGGIAADAMCVDLNVTNLDQVVHFATEKAIDFVVVAPDDPLAAGMIDALEAAGIAAFGPTKAAAQIESSKVFSKGLMRKYGIPTADYESFDDPAAAVAHLKQKNCYPAVIKADGLALGKGVVIAESEAEAVAAIHSMMEEGVFGESGRRVVIEDFLTGLEVSVLAFTDGETIRPMVSSMDHKRALDGDKGLNTGGMGTIAPHPYYTPALAARCMEEIFLPTIRAMKAEGRVFKGCLFFGLILCADGPRVIEYNCRFGDPETQVVLPLLESDLLEIMLAVHEGRLEQCPIAWKDASAACVVIASGGYPTSYQKGYPIYGLNAAGQIAIPNVEVYHAGTRAVDGRYFSNGGRVLGVTATGKTLPQALETAYRAANAIGFEGSSFRRDIGAKVL
ncbi:MAG: phosphoribosylamine--glycine ligase [Oscillospiraceae bacterium]